MLSSSHKQLLCIVWICLTMIIFHLYIAFRRRLDRQHCSSWDAEKKGTEVFVFQAVSHGLSHSLTALSTPQTGCETSKVMPIWMQKSLATADRGICQKQCRGSGQCNRAELQDMPTCSTTLQHCRQILARPILTSAWDKRAFAAAAWRGRWDGLSYACRKLLSK